MPFDRPTTAHHKDILVPYNRAMYESAMKSRWDPFKNEPVADISGLCYLLRKIVNSDP